MTLPALLLLDANGRPFSTGSTPKALITGTGVNPKPRLRVDPGQTSFFEGREFRSFFDLSIAAGAALTFRFVAPIDFILQSQQLTQISGISQYEIYLGSTPGGVWTPVASFGKNRMAERPTPLYVQQCTIDTGGTFTGGTRADVLRQAALTPNNTTQSSTASADGVRGLPAATYYGRLTNTSNEVLTGVLYLEWEERAPASTNI